MLFDLPIWQFVMEARRPGSARRVTARESPDYDGAFTPDGSHLLLVAVAQSGTPWFPARLGPLDPPPGYTTLREPPSRHDRIGPPHEESPAMIRPQRCLRLA